MEAFSETDLDWIEPDPELTDALLTVRDWVRFAVSELVRQDCAFGQGCLDAECEARWLVAAALALPRDLPPLWWDARLTLRERERLARLVTARTVQKIPTAYLLNEAWLAGKAFYLDERVIIPRSFIAELLQTQRLTDWLPHSPDQITRVLELCTGSGCLAILAAEAFPAAAITATDLSDDALEVARINVESYELSERIELRQGDLFHAVEEGQQFEVILANPPYVTAEAMDALPEEYRFEPSLALAGGEDGMALVQRIVTDAPAYLADGGMLLVEVGHNRAEADQLLTRLREQDPASVADTARSRAFWQALAPSERHERWQRWLDSARWLATAGHPEAVFVMGR